MRCNTETVKGAIVGVGEKYKIFGDCPLWDEEGLDKLVEFFDELSKAIERYGGKVLEKYVAPNGWVTFECDGEKWCLDLSFGLFKVGGD